MHLQIFLRKKECILLLKNIKEIIVNIISSRLFVLVLAFLIMFAILIQRIFQLQIIEGDTYLDDFTLTILKERNIPSTRGNIYDKNGELLAYNELAYSVTIEDNGTYSSNSEKNKILNDIIYKLINIIEANGDSIINDFNIVLDKSGNYSYTVEDRQRLRFIADVFGKKTIDELEDKADLTASEIIDYLKGPKQYEIGDKYTEEEALKIITIRYAMALNGYQKYIATTVAEDVSDETVAVVMENTNELQGVAISEGSIRRYVDSVYFSHIIGYTGKISQEEFESLQLESDSYKLTDIVGKSGIEKYMETNLQGEKGKEKVFVDNLGKVIETAERTEPTAGNDVYLTIDKKLQEAVYHIIEQKLAGILVTNIKNIKEYVPTATSTASDIKIPIDDVYFALIDNNIIDTNHFSKEDASDTERNVHSKYQNKKESVLAQLTEQLNSEAALPYEALSDEMQVYISNIVTILTNNQILKREAIDTEDEMYLAWRNEAVSLRDYLNYAISNNWIDITKVNVENQYSTSEEIYSALIDYITDALESNIEFDKKLYKYMISDNTLSGQEVCVILYDQGILKDNEETAMPLAMLSANGAYNFMLNKISNLEITPAQLALEPCSGSAVITDVNTGDVLACVTYPSYDNNRLANSIDADYYNQLLNDKSYPLLNRATQQKTAPGSTFKMVTASAGLEEGRITTSTIIEDLGLFDKVNSENRCWKYPSNHGKINVTEAIRDSCNYFFYEVGYQLSLNSTGQYVSSIGTDTLKKYAQMFGLGETSGVEITESAPQISDEYSIISAIGQGNNNYANVQLAKYVTTVANRGICYNLTLLDKLTDSKGNVIEEYSPTVYNTLDEIHSSTWNAIQNGMHAVIENTDIFDSVEMSVAGKTGTAQESKTKPNHALFVCYAPFENPEIAISVQIANGYTSGNAAEIARDIIRYRFELADEEEVISGTATQTNSVIQD